MSGALTDPPGFDDVDIGAHGTPRSFELTRSDLVRYAGASGDFNPMHHDEIKATASGLPSVFGHGMFSAAYLAGAVTDFVGVGRLTSFDVRFTKQAWPGRVLTTEVVVCAKVAAEESGLLELDCRLVDDNGDVIVTGTASARLPRTPKDIK
jgi:acyl dehydratase